ncbi:aminoglycoside phosphotransferase [Apodospora peruviana]|uniref:Aminoglycoside phosphotransferase n=1 Tax=Apodospora peruviana TaxID=516989 RepID=A0AAE0IQW2_9PEZI|nr:aminoglycoside phosphotransferase [Apodospora peruviana]
MSTSVSTTLILNEPGILTKLSAKSKNDAKTRIRGEPLSRGWVTGLDSEKTKILAQLRDMISEMRNLPSPNGGKFVGVADVTGKGPVFDLRLPRKSHWGPFETVCAFHRELLGGQDVKDFGEEQFPGLKELAAFYGEEWPRLVFTHGDLSNTNIMVRGDEIVSIIDWETVGWMPPYWEYTSAWHVNPQDAFWQAEVGRFITPDPRVLDMEIIRRKYFGNF